MKPGTIETKDVNRGNTQGGTSWVQTIPFMYRSNVYP